MSASALKGTAMATSAEHLSDLPKVISVDDHVIEPAHLFETWLPSKHRERGPRPFIAGIGDLQYIGGKYRFTTDPDGQLTDWWVRGVDLPLQACDRSCRLLA